MLFTLNVFLTICQRKLGDQPTDWGCWCIVVKQLIVEEPSQESRFGCFEGIEVIDWMIISADLTVLMRFIEKKTLAWHSSVRSEVIV